VNGTPVRSSITSAAHLFADSDGVRGRSHLRDLRKADASEGGRNKFIGNMPVERAGEIRKEQWKESETFNDVT
jgi:hypothetical protein